jgi:signal transduction histidine kinase/PAS domain-containing protein
VLQSRVVPADGSVRWLEVRIFVQPRAGTQPLAHIVLLDLTERRLLASLADELADRREAQAEARGEERLLEARLVERARLAAVTENRRRLQAIIDGAPAAIFGRDRDGKFLFANQTCQRILGWPPADGADPLSERERRVMDSGETISEELSLRPAGAAADATFLVQRFPLRDATGTIYCVCAIATDITASRAMEAERRTRVGQQHLISALATQLAEGLAEPALVAAATRSACVGLEAKGAAVYRAGPGADVELVGQHALTADARTAAAEIAAAAIRTAGAPTTRHAVALMVPGIIEPATVLVVLVEAGQRLDESDRFFLEEVVRLLAIARARRHAAELEQQLIRAQRMESVGKLAGGVAHDFNNLLAVIMNYGAFVSEALEERDADVRADVAEILRAAERAAELTRSLLLFGGAGAVSDERCDPNQVVQALVETFRRTLGADVKTVVSLQPGVDHVALAAADLKELVVALATNACEAMPAGGTLSIQTGATPDGTRLVVGDDGEGMSADVLDRALEPFFTTRPPGKGKGLGLATVHGLAGRAGGKVQLSSTVGTGTTVTLDLPGIGRVAGAAAARAALPLGAATVLLVEDEPGVRDVVRRILESGGYRVLAAAGPAEARSIAATEEFDLLLTDVVMPGESGPDLAATLPGGPGSSALLFMSGYAEEVFDRRGGLPTGLRLVEKPFTRQVLLDAVAAAIADHRRAVT